MKKLLTFALVCCLVFSSSSTVFATATQWDNSDKTNLSNAASRLSTIISRLTTISNKLNDIYDTLGSNDKSIGYWVESINNWMQPIYGRLSDIITNSLNIETVAGLLGKTEVINGVTVRTPYLSYNGKGIGEYTYNIKSSVDNVKTSVDNVKSTVDNIYSLDNQYFPNLPYLLDLKTGLTNTDPAVHSNFNGAYAYTHAHSQMFGRSYDGNTGDVTTLRYFMPAVSSNGGQTAVGSYWTNGSPIGNIAQMLQLHMQNQVRSYVYTWDAELDGYNDTQSARNWLTLNGASFTPTSAINGIYTWLKRIQDPTARLAYVLANDQEIAARDAAADNQQSVVNNFIDSSGSGAASTTDISNISGLSSGFKNNISTDASVSGIWNIFNSDNFGWFSQETADQLDTTGSGSRKLRSSGFYPTPLLDQQTEDILKYIGGDNND